MASGLSGINVKEVVKTKINSSTPLSHAKRFLNVFFLSIMYLKIYEHKNTIAA